MKPALISLVAAAVLSCGILSPQTSAHACGKWPVGWIAPDQSAAVVADAYAEFMDRIEGLSARKRKFLAKQVGGLSMLKRGQAVDVIRASIRHEDLMLISVPDGRAWAVETELQCDGVDKEGSAA